MRMGAGTLRRNGDSDSHVLHFNDTCGIRTDPGRHDPEGGQFLKFVKMVCTKNVQNDAQEHCHQNIYPTLSINGNVAS